MRNEYKIVAKYDGFEREYFCNTYGDAITVFDAFSRVWSGARVELYQDTPDTPEGEYELLYTYDHRMAA